MSSKAVLDFRSRSIPSFDDLLMEAILCPPRGDFRAAGDRFLGSTGIQLSRGFTSAVLGFRSRSSTSALGSWALALGSWALAPAFHA